MAMKHSQLTINSHCSLHLQPRLRMHGLIINWYFKYLTKVLQLQTLWSVEQLGKILNGMW